VPALFFAPITTKVVRFLLHRPHNLVSSQA